VEVAHASNQWGKEDEAGRPGVRASLGYKIKKRKTQETKKKKTDFTTDPINIKRTTLCQQVWQFRKEGFFWKIDTRNKISMY
jgi:hypothetical protein